MSQYARTPVDALTARRLGLAPGWDRAALEAAQIQALQGTLRTAMQKSPWYARRFAGLDPASMRTGADLSDLPLLCASDIADQGHVLLCVSQSEVARIITLHTSGSTGTPKRLFFTRQDLDATEDFFLHGMFSLITPQDRVLALLPWEQPDCTGDLLIRALTRQKIACQGVWPPPEWADLAQKIHAEKITSVVGLPQHMLALSQKLAPHQVRTMLLCSDYAPHVLRQRIEQACGCTTFLHYGTTETGLGGGVECTAHAGCHVRESELLVEIIDPDTGQVLPEGELGEVVVTTLGRQAMPLIRYRTKDMARLTTEPCVCTGRTARLYDISGRRSTCVLPGEIPLSSQTLDDALFGLDGLMDYRATIEAMDGQVLLRLDFLCAPALSLEAELHNLLMGLEPIALAVGHGLCLGPVQRVDVFAASHTIKRTIVDTRRK
ncbi:AMP-binding protein [Desulfovibrionales bacterium]